MDGKKKSEPRSVRNQDIALLQSVYALMQSVVSIERRRKWQKERMDSLTQHLTGMPRGSGSSGGMDCAFACLSELEEEHSALVEEYTAKLRLAEQIINSIESDNMRAFVTMMYLDSIPDREVRLRLNMTEYRFNAARDAVEKAENMRSVVWHDRYGK